MGNAQSSEDRKPRNREQLKAERKAEKLAARELAAATAKLEHSYGRSLAEAYIGAGEGPVLTVWQRQYRAVNVLTKTCCPFTPVTSALSDQVVGKRPTAIDCVTPLPMPHTLPV